MKHLALHVAMPLLFASPAFAQPAQQPPSGAMQLLGRCTTEAAQLLDRLAMLEADNAKLKSDGAKNQLPPDGTGQPRVESK